MGIAGTLLRNLAATGLTLSLLLCCASIAAAFSPRVPQVEFNSANLQGLNPINPLTDQLDAQVWEAWRFNSLLIEFTTPNTAHHAIGLYIPNMPASPLFNIFPGTASAGWFAVAHLAGGSLTVTLFDQNAVILGQTTYAGVNANAFGFYLEGPAGTFYSEDSRNGGSPALLTYMGAGSNFGDFWQCFESSTDPTPLADFSDVVLLMSWAVYTPTNSSTWGRLKGLYRR